MKKVALIIAFIGLLGLFACSGDGGSGNGGGDNPPGQTDTVNSSTSNQLGNTQADKATLQ